MGEVKMLVCGTRSKVIPNYREKVREELNDWLGVIREKYPTDSLRIVEGCCPHSADVYAEEWAKEKGIPISHFPANKGNYLKRNMEMVEFSNMVIAFWDGFSYGTAHTIATAADQGRLTRIIRLKKA